MILDDPGEIISIFNFSYYSLNQKYILFDGHSKNVVGPISVQEAIFSMNWAEDQEKYWVFKGIFCLPLIKASIVPTSLSIFILLDIEFNLKNFNHSANTLSKVFSRTFFGSSD